MVQIKSSLMVKMKELTKSKFFYFILGHIILKEKGKEDLKSSYGDEKKKWRKGKTGN